MAKKYDLENKLKNFNKNIAIQGEIIGPGIQKNKLQLKDVELRVFNVFDINEYRYYNYREFNDLILEFDLKSVPMFATKFQPIYLKDFTVDKLVELSKGFSTLNSQILREGIVFKTFDEIQDSKFGRLGFKVINPDFLLKYD
jgi:ATP-dependent RNA circularization protein (DNA/RNA ligase family)